MGFFPPDTIMILPSALAARDYLNRAARGTGGGVVLSARVMTFGRLLESLAQELETTARPATNLAVWLMTVEELGRPEAESIWPGNPGGPRLGVRALKLIEHLRAAGAPPEELAGLAQNHGAGAKAFARLYEACARRLEDQGLSDGQGRTAQVLKRLAQGPGFKRLEATRQVLVRGFAYLSPLEARTLLALASAGLDVRLELNRPAWMDGLELAEEGLEENPLAQIRRLMFLFESHHSTPGQIDILQAPPLAGQAESLAHAAQNLFAPRPQRAPGGPGPDLKVVAAPSRYREAEILARGVMKLLEKGVEMSRIVIACADLGQYGRLVEDVFRRYRLPLVFRRGEPLNTQAVFRAALALFEAAASNLSAQAVVDLLATPYLGLGQAAPGWATAARVTAAAGVVDETTGGGWDQALTSYARRRGADQAEARRLAGFVAELKKDLAPLNQPASLTTHIGRLKTLLEKYRLAENALAPENPFQARDAAALARMDELLEELSLASVQTGAEMAPMPAAQAAQRLGQAAALVNVGDSLAPGLGVRVLNIYDLMGLEYDYLFLAGLNEQDFPRPRPEDSFFPDALRIELNQRIASHALAPSQAAYLEQKLLFHQGLCQARLGAVLSFRLTEDGDKPALASTLLDDLAELWENFAIEKVEPYVLAPIEDALAEDELIGQLAARGQGPSPLLKAVLNRQETRPRWESIVRRAEREILAGQHAHLDPWLAGQWLARQKRHEGWPLISPSRLEEYGQCPFRFQTLAILELAEPCEQQLEISPLDEGNLAHQALARFMERMKKEGRLPLGGEEKERQTLEETLAEVLSQATRLATGLGPLWRARQKRLAASLLGWLAQEQRAAPESEHEPHLFEWRFGPGEAEPPLGMELASGGRVFFQGQADRLDLGPRDCLVIDYKNASDKGKYRELLKQENMGRTSFQAPIYQLAASRLTGLPARAAFVALKSSPGRVFDKKAPPTDAPFFEAGLERRRQMLENGEPNFFNQLEETWNRLAQGDFRPTPGRSCDFCALAQACRAASQDEGEGGEGA